MRHQAGLWLSRIIPKLEEKVSNADWKLVLESAKIKEKEKKEGSAPVTEELPTKSMYPAGKPLRFDEKALSNQHRPKSMSSGAYLRWDYSSQYRMLGEER